MTGQGNFSVARTEAAIGLVDLARAQMESESFSGETALVGLSHGGNVSIEPLNMMTEMEEFYGVELNLLTINIHFRDDYQLSDAASGRVIYVDIYDEMDPVQSNRGDSWFNKGFGLYSTWLYRSDQ